MTDPHTRAVEAAWLAAVGDGQTGAAAQIVTIDREDLAAAIRAYLAAMEAEGVYLVSYRDVYDVMMEPWLDGAPLLEVLQAAFSACGQSPAAMIAARPKGE